MPPLGHEPLLRAVCADPEDDTVRLVYADWLDENGDPDRAEFIRLQVGRLHAPFHVRGEMIRIEDELLRSNRDIWYGELPDTDAVTWSSFIRGFVFGLGIASASNFARQGALILSAAPVTHLNFPSVGPDELAQFVSVPEIRQIRYMSLHVSRQLHGSWRSLTECPHLTNLRSLSILSEGDLLTDAEALSLAEAPGLPLLDELNLFGTISAVSEATLRVRFKAVNFHSL